MNDYELIRALGFKRLAFSGEEWHYVHTRLEDPDTALMNEVVERLRTRRVGAADHGMFVVMSVSASLPLGGPDAVDIEVAGRCEDCT